MIREVDDYNDAYLVYLAETSIPTIIARDETFGLRRDQLRTTLRARRERVLLPEAATACDAILGELDGTASALGGSGFDQQW